jgi:hypothetical protein
MARRRTPHIPTVSSPLRSRWTHIAHPESGDFAWGIFKAGKWDVYSLGVVWTNAEGGYYKITSRSKIGTVALPPDYTDEYLLKTLKAAGLSKYTKKHLRLIEVEGDDFLISIYYDGKPIFQLERV